MTTSIDTCEPPKKRQPWKIDIPVLILFFCRDEQLRKVFASVKAARPSRLYLYQDGPRPGREDDITGCMRCREIVGDGNIDWDCEVHRCYQTENSGCDPSEYRAQKWFFSHVDMGIVLEDDDVPAQSFFPFCKELLEKYRDDARVNMICGMNNIERIDWTPYSYVFTTSGAITGWASWRRVIDMWEETIPCLEDRYFRQTFAARYRGMLDTKAALDRFERNNSSGTAHYEAIMGANALRNSMLNIVPTLNQISNIGITADAAHSGASLKTLPRGIRRIFFMRTYELEFPLRHPPYVMEDMRFLSKINRRMGRGFLRGACRRAESVLLRIRYGQFRSLWDALRRRLHGREDLAP